MWLPHYRRVLIVTLYYVMNTKMSVLFQHENNNLHNDELCELRHQIWAQAMISWLLFISCLCFVVYICLRCIHRSTVKLAK